MIAIGKIENKYFHKIDCLRRKNPQPKLFFHAMMRAFLQNLTHKNEKERK